MTKKDKAETSNDSNFFTGLSTLYRFADRVDIQVKYFLYINIFLLNFTICIIIRVVRS